MRLLQADGATDAALYEQLADDANLKPSAGSDRDCRVRTNPASVQLVAGEGASCPTSEFSADALRTQLVAGAAVGGRATTRAAVHLLTFTELPDRSGFAELVEVVEFHEHDDGDTIQVAVIRDWAAVHALAIAAGLTGDDQRMLALAVSLASGQPVDLAANVAVSGPTNARRVVEAIAIATDHGEM